LEKDLPDDLRWRAGRSLPPKLGPRGRRSTWWPRIWPLRRPRGPPSPWRSGRERWLCARRESPENDGIKTFYWTCLNLNMHCYCV
jgi:hypothetical protein